ncbi:hypothetical protein STEG23_013631 [Scotinomys teguina]
MDSYCVMLTEMALVKLNGSQNQTKRHESVNKTGQDETPQFDFQHSLILNSSKRELAKMGRRQCKSAYNIIKNKTTPESSPPPTPKSDYCNADKAEENDLKKSLMKMLEEAFEEKMKNVSKEIGENTNKKLEEINKEIEEKKSKKLEEMNNEIEEKKNKKLEEMNNEIEEKKTKEWKK